MPIVLEFTLVGGYYIPIPNPEPAPEVHFCLDIPVSRDLGMDRMPPGVMSWPLFITARIALAQQEDSLGATGMCNARLNVQWSDIDRHMFCTIDTASSHSYVLRASMVWLLGKLGIEVEECRPQPAFSVPVWVRLAPSPGTGWVHTDLGKEEGEANAESTAAQDIQP